VCLKENGVFAYGTGGREGSIPKVYIGGYVDFFLLLFIINHFRALSAAQKFQIVCILPYMNSQRVCGYTQTQSFPQCMCLRCMIYIDAYMYTYRHIQS